MCSCARTLNSFIYHIMATLYHTTYCSTSVHYESTFVRKYFRILSPCLSPYCTLCTTVYSSIYVYTYTSVHVHCTEVSCLKSSINNFYSTCTRTTLYTYCTRTTYFRTFESTFLFPEVIIPYFDCTRTRSVQYTYS
jgi:hypothetical protein